MSLAPKLEEEAENDAQEGERDGEDRPANEGRILHNVGSSELIAMLIGAENVEPVSDTEDDEAHVEETEEE